MQATLAVWTSYYYDLTPEDAVLELKRNGIMAAELSDEHGEVLLRRGDPRKVGAAFRRFVEDEGFTMTQGHLWLRIRLCAEGAYEQLLSWIDLYEAIGIENAVLHVDQLRDEEISDEERFARNRVILEKLAADLQGRRFRLCLENLSGFVANADGLLRLIEGLDPANFGICLDTGHLHLRGSDSQRDFILRVGSRLHALHIANNDRSRDQHLLPYAIVGGVDFEEVVAALREIDYKGLFNYEIPGERKAPMPILGEKLRYTARLTELLFSE